MLSVRDGLSQQHADVVVVEGVDGASTVALTHDEPQMSQHAQLLGDRWLLHLDVACEFGH